MAKQSSRFRDVDGIVLLDKPLGLSSNQALQRVRHLFKAAKAGHTGSLDPLATGVLPLCLGEATKFSQYLLDADKVYLTRAKLGVRTNTGDAEGEPIAERPVPALSDELLEAVLTRFRGAIEQIPPMYSALKHEGRPLYKLARNGVEVDRPARPVHIYALDLLSWGADFLELRVRCSKGTYIRTLVEDIGEALGCGAHVTLLRREQSAGFGLAQSVTLEQLQADAAACATATDGTPQWESLDRYLLPVDAGLADFSIISLDSAQSHSILQGQMVKIPPGAPAGLTRLQDETGRFIGLGEVSGDQVKPHRLLRAK